MIKNTNTILYCGRWEETVRFYRDRLNLPVCFSTDWFVEFSLNAVSRISIADEKRASIKTAHGKGITLSWEIDRIENAWADLKKNGMEPTAIRNHPWGARYFFLVDPEGHRIEFWQSLAEKPSIDMEMPELMCSCVLGNQSGRHQFV